MKKFLTKAIESLHLRIFGHEMSPTMRQFFGNLSWSFVGIITSSIILFAINLAAGRVLGPEGYGNYNLIVSIASFSAIIIAFGFENTAVKLISETDQKKLIGALAFNAIIAMILTSSIYLAIGGIFRNEIANWLGADRALIIIALVYSVLLTMRNLMDNLNKAMKFFKRQARIKIIESLIVLFLFATFFFIIKKQSYEFYIIAYALGMIIGTILYYQPIKGFLQGFNSKVFEKAKSYQKITLFVSFIGITIATADKFLVAKFLGASELGLYSAYLMSSTILISQLILIVNNVFFPMINAEKNKKQIMLKVDRLSVFIALPALIFTALTSLIILKIFGRAYGINWLYILIVAFVALGQIVVGLYGSIIASSESFLRFNSKIYYFKPLFIGLLYLLAYSVSQFNLYSIFLIVLASYLYDIISTKLTVALIKE